MQSSNRIMTAQFIINSLNTMTSSNKRTKVKHFNFVQKYTPCMTEFTLIDINILSYCIAFSLFFLSFLSCLMFSSHHLSLQKYYQKDIKVYPEGGTLLFKNIFLKNSTLHKCIGLYTLGILHCELETIVTHKTGC